MHLFERMHRVPSSSVEYIHNNVSSTLLSNSLISIFLFLVNKDDVISDKSNDSNHSQQAFSVPHTPCPAFSKFLYFIFAPTLIYRDSYPRTSSIRWKYVLSQLAQFAAAALFSYYLFYRFCLPVFRHFKSEHVTVKIFVLSILNCTLPGALLLFCGKFRWNQFIRK